MLAIALVFFGHWLASVFLQSFFLHRYGAHRQFSLSPRWERAFYFATWLMQGSSFLNPRAYAILHREHHAFSDTERDPHSPHFHTNPLAMMIHTVNRYEDFARRRVEPEQRFAGGYPEWPALDRFADHWATRLAFCAIFVLIYLALAPSAAYFALLPFHFVMGPVHGSIVNWCGHKYGYRNFAMRDASRNCLPIDFVTLGELFQNNHHKAGMSPNFAVRWFELDPTYVAIRIFAALGIVRLRAVSTEPETQDGVVAEPATQAL